MAKVLVLCVTLAIVGVMCESKSISKEETPCVNCIEQDYNRIKRQAWRIIDSVQGLVTGIIGTSMSYAERMQAQRLQSQRKSVIIGPGQNNNNHVILNGDGWDI